MATKAGNIASAEVKLAFNLFLLGKSMLKHKPIKIQDRIAKTVLKAKMALRDAKEQ